MTGAEEPTVTYKRVLLKISGEALMGDQGYGLHPPTVSRIAAEVKTWLGKPRGGRGTAIVYTGSRRNAESVAEALMAEEAR